MLKITEEQLNIIEQKDFNVLVIKAFAGTGKTTTLKQFALKHPEKRMLYIAYNKEIANQARQNFPKNVESRTAHSLAYYQFGKPLEKKLNRKMSMPFKPNTIRTFFGFEKTKDGMDMAEKLYKIIENYCFSSYKSIKEAIPYEKTFNELRPDLEFFSDLLWNEMINPKTKFPTIPDVYLKQFVLSKPFLNYDYILFDESQDANPLILELITNQQYKNVKLVFVGDEHQSIYQFRGATNAFKNIYADKELYLTNSFRFGEKIASVANEILSQFKYEKKQIMGLSSIQDEIGCVNKEEQFAIISRTNSSLLLNALAAYEKNKTVCFVGGFDSYNFKQILELENLYLGKNKNVKDTYLKTFNTFNDYEATANFSNDREMNYNIKIIKKYSGDLNNIFKEIKENIRSMNDAEIILSTVHKSKGLEFKQVILSNDFQQLLTKDKDGINVRISEEEVNMIYVGVTRAIERLQLNKNIENFIEYRRKNLNSNEIIMRDGCTSDYLIDTINSEDKYSINRISNELK